MHAYLTNGAQDKRKPLFYRLDSVYISTSIQTQIVLKRNHNFSQKKALDFASKSKTSLTIPNRIIEAPTEWQLKVGGRRKKNMSFDVCVAINIHVSVAPVPIPRKTWHASSNREIVNISHFCNNPFRVLHRQQLQQFSVSVGCEFQLETFRDPHSHHCIARRCYHSKVIYYHLRFRLLWLWMNEAINYWMKRDKRRAWWKIRPTSPALDDLGCCCRQFSHEMARIMATLAVHSGASRRAIGSVCRREWNYTSRSRSLRTLLQIPVALFRLVSCH